MSQSEKIDLKESVRQYVIQNLPFDQGDAALAAYIHGLDAHDLLVALHNWSDRLIKPVPRQVHQSMALRQNLFSQQYQIPLRQIISDIELGLDIKKYLSRGVQVAVSLPQTDNRLQRRSDLDLMLNDWRMHHLHLATSVESDGFVTRTGPLLFCIFNVKDAYLIDIMDHGSWTAKNLLEIVVREFPNSGCFDELKNVAGLASNATETDHKKARDVGINNLHSIDGKVIMPGGGLSMAGTTLKATIASNKLLRELKVFEDSWEKDPSKIRSQLSQKNVRLPPNPQFEFYIHPDLGAGLYERINQTFIELGLN